MTDDVAGDGEDGELGQSQSQTGKLAHGSRELSCCIIIIMVTYIFENIIYHVVEIKYKARLSKFSCNHTFYSNPQVTCTSALSYAKRK